MTHLGLIPLTKYMCIRLNASMLFFRLKGQLRVCKRAPRQTTFLNNELKLNVAS